MAIAPVNPNINYAEPLQISSEPVNAYFRNREIQQRQAAADARLSLQEKIHEDTLAHQRQQDIARRMKEVSNLGKYDMGGLWHNEQMQAISKFQDELANKIKNGDSDWQEFAYKAASQLEGNRRKAQTYDKMIKERLSQYGKDKSVILPKMHDLLIGKTAYNPDGTLKDINDLDIQSAMAYNPMTDPDADAAFNNDILSDALAGNFKNNTITIGDTNRATGNSVTRTITAPEYIRMNGATGMQSLNKEAVSADPVLSDSLFDQYRSKNGTVDLIKEGIYQQSLSDPRIVGAIAREINKHNRGLTPDDKDYVEPNSHSASLIGRAVVTNLLARQKHGNFSLRRSYGKPSRSAGGGGSRGGSTSDKMDTAGILERFKGVMNQDPNYLQNNEGARLPTDPTTGKPMGDIIDVTPVFKNFFVGQNKSGKPIEAPHIVVRKDDPGKIFIDYGNDEPPEIVSEQDLPRWLNSKAKLNKNLDPVKLNELYPKYFNTQTSPEKPQTPLQRASKVVKDTVRNLFGTGSTVKEVPAGSKPTKKHKNNPFG